MGKYGYYGGRKIHRSRNLYKTKKSTAGKFVTALVFVAVIAGLVIVGYAAGKPVLEYFRNSANEELTVGWQPPVNSPDSANDMDNSGNPNSENAR